MTYNVSSGMFNPTIPYHHGTKCYEADFCLPSYSIALTFHILYDVDEHDVYAQCLHH